MFYYYYYSQVKMADWETVTILRKKPPKASAMKSEQVIFDLFKILFYNRFQNICFQF